jgi:hypothetical protein
LAIGELSYVQKEGRSSWELSIEDRRVPPAIQKENQSVFSKCPYDKRGKGVNQHTSINLEFHGFEEGVEVPLVPGDEMDARQRFLRGAGSVKVEEIDQIDQTAVCDFVELFSIIDKPGRELFTLV